MTSTASGWSQVSIADIANFASGELISVASLSEESGLASIPVFGGNGIVGYTQVATVVEPTVILGRVGQKCGVVYTNSGPAWITDNALFARSFKRRVDTSFFAYALEHVRLNDLKNRNDLPLITQSILRDVLIAIPESIDEQERIAGAIRRADDLIDSLEQLIAKKRNIQQGLMQELLTGRIRIDSVAGAWLTVRLLDLVTIVSGQVDPRRPEFRDLPLIAPDHIESGTGRLLAVKTAVEQGAISGKYLAEPGDVIYSKIRPYLRKAHVARFRTLCSADMYPLRPKIGVDPEFVLNTLLGARFTDFATSASMRSGIPKINRVELAAFELAAPPSEEQQEIAEVLLDADAEIAALERRLESARAIKTGMMQELLTGRTRLPVEAAS